MSEHRASPLQPSPLPPLQHPLTWTLPALFTLPSPHPSDPTLPTTARANCRTLTATTFRVHLCLLHPRTALLAFPSRERLVLGKTTCLYFSRTNVTFMRNTLPRFYARTNFTCANKRRCRFHMNKEHLPPIDKDA
ncbi:hypothetical protein E2C01_068516 [Portunus trituberculatus]|uniref:Uncharacterized protein n=1 Tax=Portunus trituberculatus TaxID=210409 RepID=A0A5B7HWP2_PORTR|nr:hypothetical protein [Portunus trituberculatus]